MPPWGPDTSTAQRIEGLEAGRYSLFVRGLGYYIRHDTISVFPGVTDSIRVPLETWLEGSRNVHHCRPKGFRRAGESACVTAGPEVERQVDFARDLMRPERSRLFKLPALDSTKLALLRDERVCERAGRAYGEPADPPRRVIVVRMDTLYLVWDPFEPVTGGEYEIHMIFDRFWRRIAALAE